MKTWTSLNVSEETNRWNKAALQMSRELRAKPEAIPATIDKIRAIKRCYRNWTRGKGFKP